MIEFTIQRLDYLSYQSNPAFFIFGKQYMPPVLTLAQHGRLSL
jgi:hypothetical protein